MIRQLTKSQQLWVDNTLDSLNLREKIGSFLLNDMPYLDTLVNTYSACPDSVDMLVKALFGEIPFNCRSPVDTGGWRP